MATNSLNVKAAVAGAAGSGLSLAWFAPVGTSAPTTPTSALNAAFLDAGLCAQTGIEEDDSTSTTSIPAFGTTQPVRILTLSETLTFHLTMLETNAVSAAVYYRQALGSITPVTGTGVFSVTQGTYTRQLYAAVFDMVDGSDHKRIYCPQLEVTDKDTVTNTPTNTLQYGVTLTAYPNSSGIAVQTFFQVASLG